MVMLIISLYIGKKDCFQKCAVCNSLFCDPFTSLFLKCPIAPLLWGTMGQCQEAFYSMTIYIFTMSLLF